MGGWVVPLQCHPEALHCPGLILGPQRRRGALPVLLTGMGTSRPHCCLRGDCGSSLAGGTAHSHLTLPSGVQPDAVVLESPYTNIRDAGANIPITKVSLGLCPAVTGGGSASGVPSW